MTEEFLHYIWRYRLYHNRLSLTTGEEIEVFDPGMYNTDSGPDFFNARVRIGNTLWAGNVEIHINSSDWYRHKHQGDRAYENLILHVVYQHDREIPWFGNSNLPTLELKEYVSKQTWQNYLRFMASKNWIPCENMILDVDAVIIRSWLDRLMVERLERKARLVEETLLSSMNDWNHTFYKLIARNMGFKLNNEAFERLSVSISYQHLLRHSDNLVQVEAMLFGQAGMLNASFLDEYPNSLKKEYDFLRHKYSLVSIENHLWRYLRLHPGNFPTIRISQFANLIYQAQGLPLQLIESRSAAGIKKMFEVGASAYWDDHYRFDKPSPHAAKRLGEVASALLMINLVVPFIFAYGMKKGNSEHTSFAMQILEQTDAENNSVIRRWQRLGIQCRNAWTTQALLELKSSYCDRKKCLSCGIGSAILK